LENFFTVENYVEDREIYEETNSRAINVIAVDALHNVGLEQYHKDSVRRELNKLYSGLMDWKTLTTSPHQYYSTGLWGSTHFGTDKQLKSLIQIMACSQAGINIRYFSYFDMLFFEKLPPVVEKIVLREWKVGDLFNIVMDSITKLKDNFDLFDYILSL